MMRCSPFIFSILQDTRVSDQSADRDDPGIATHTGNNADRGFNTTPGSVVGQYLEVCPLTHRLWCRGLTGGAIFEFYQMRLSKLIQELRHLALT